LSQMATRDACLSQAGLYVKLMKPLKYSAEPKISSL